VGNKISSQDELPVLSDAMLQLALLIKSQLPIIAELLEQLRAIESQINGLSEDIEFLHKEYHMPNIQSRLIQYISRLWKSIRIDKSFYTHYSDATYIKPYTYVMDRLTELSQDLSIILEDLLSFQLDEGVDPDDAAALFSQLEYNFLRFDQVVFRLAALVTLLRLQLVGERERDPLKEDIEADIIKVLQHES